jgi:hypothetical protein
MPENKTTRRYHMNKLHAATQRLDALLSLATQAMESEGFTPTLRQFEFVVDTALECLDAILASVKEVHHG